MAVMLSLSSNPPIRTLPTLRSTFKQGNLWNFKPNPFHTIHIRTKQQAEKGTRCLVVVNQAAKTQVSVTASNVRFRLDNLGPRPGSRKKAKRKGRGHAAGQGGSCGFGMRGQKSSSGPGVRKGFEGGQMPLYRRIPKLRGIAGASLGTHQGIWEDPEDGSGYEYDEYDDDDDEQEEEEADEEEENDGFGFQQGNPVRFVDNSTMNQYEEDLAKEVEQLLGAEEKAILEQNASPNQTKISTAKWRPLQTLALSLQIRFMDKLLEDGLNIDEVDKDGQTALHKAIIGKKEAVISHLLRKGANPHVKDKDGATPLHYAVHVSALQTVKLLLKYDVDVNVADLDGWTPLHIAIQSRNRDIAKVLLVNGADKTRKNKDGNTALDLSLCYGKDFKSYDLAKLLKILPADGYL